MRQHCVTDDVVRQRRETDGVVRQHFETVDVGQFCDTDDLRQRCETKISVVLKLG